VSRLPSIENGATSLRIASSDLRTLETIAQAAGQPKVLFRIRPATRLGQDMVDFQ
jgi:hypothetical protein